MFDHFDRGNYDKLANEKSDANTTRNFIYQSLDNFDEERNLWIPLKEENTDQNTENSKTN